MYVNTYVKTHLTKEHVVGTGWNRQLSIRDESFSPASLHSVVPVPGIKT